MAFLAVFGITLLGVSPALAAGTTPLSLVQQFDSTGKPLSGCQITFFQAGTIATKQNVYSDFGLTSVLPNPLSCDQSGRVPQHWLADGLIHIRLTDASGAPQVDTTMQVLGPSSGGGGGGGTVDPTTIMATGDVKSRYGTGPLSGFVRLNGLTIGSAASGGSERANADTQSLFVYLCSTDPNLAVSGGRSGNCLSDFNANKTITLPDMRDRVIAGLGDMGNSDAARFTAAYFGVTGTTLGAVGGAESLALTVAQLPAITSTGTAGGANYLPLSSGGWFNQVIAPAAGVTTVQYAGGLASSLTIPATVTSTGTLGSAHRTVQPTMLMTYYMKL